MSRILVVHGTGGPVRHDDSVRLEWITSIRDGLALAGNGATFADDDVVVVNLDGAATGSSAAPGAATAEIGAWVHDIARRCLAVGLFDGAPPPADRDDPWSVASALSYSRFFTGLPVEEIHETLRVLHAYLTGAADALVRAHLTEDVRIVVGHSLGAVPAIRVTAETTPAVPSAAGSTLDVSRVLLTVGVPLGLPAGGRPGWRWLNLVDRYDTLALATGLANRRGDTPIDCDPRVRAVRPYVASPEFGHAFTRALCLETTAYASGRCP